MTVRELLARLEGVDPDLIVYTTDYESGDEVAEEVVVERDPGWRHVEIYRVVIR